MDFFPPAHLKKGFAFLCEIIAFCVLYVKILVDTERDFS